MNTNTKTQETVTSPSPSAHAVKPVSIEELEIETNPEEAKELWEAFRQANGFSED
jgi:hypothetical protein